MLNRCCLQTGCLHSLYKSTIYNALQTVLDSFFSWFQFIEGEIKYTYAKVTCLGFFFFLGIIFCFYMMLHFWCMNHAKGIISNQRFRLHLGLESHLNWLTVKLYWLVTWLEWNFWLDKNMNKKKPNTLEPPKLIKCFIHNGAFICQFSECHAQ